MSRIAVFGATSAIAQEYCRIAAARHGRLFIAGRNAERIAALAADLTVRGAERVTSAVVDLADIDGHARLVDEADAALDGCEVALVAHGVLPDQQAAQRDAHVMADAVAVNFISAVSICERLAEHFEARRRGTIAVIGSVAGDRGRASAYVYNSTKAALDTYLAGLRQRLWSAGVAVVTIKPGLVDTPMTAHLPKGSLFASPETVARGVDDAIQKRRAVAYVPWFWRWIMLVIRLMPEPIFRRLKL